LGQRREHVAGSHGIATLRATDPLARAVTPSLCTSLAPGATPSDLCDTRGPQVDHMRGPVEGSAKGIFKTDRGWRAFVRVEGILYAKRFPPTATLTEMKRWREETRVQARAGAIATKARRQTTTGFAADADRYLVAVRAMPTYGEREQHILEWVTVFGERARGSITSDEIRAQLHRWRQADLAASSVNHRRTALMHLYSVLDGRGSANPVSAVPRFREPAAEPRGMPLDQVRAILGKMDDTVSRARLSVIAWTGIPHKSLMRIRPEHVDWEAGTVFVPGREKGKGTRGRRVPLTREGLQALRAVKRHEGWGPFSTSSVRKSWLEAALKAGLATRDPESKGKTWRNIQCPYRPYDLRHSFGTAVYQASGDIRATQELLGHSTLALTSRYTLGAVDDRLTRAVAALDAAKAPTPHKGGERLPPAVASRKKPAKRR